MNKTSVLVALFTVALLVAAYFILSSVLLYLAIGFVLALIGRPVVNVLEKVKYKRFKLGRGLSAFITLLLYYFVIFAVFSSITPVLIKEAISLSRISPSDIVKNIDPFIKTIENQIFDLTGNNFLVKDYIQEKVIAIFNFETVTVWLNAITSFTGGLLMAFFTISFILFFLLKDGELLIKNFFNLFPKKYQDEVKDIQPEVKNKLTRYFLGISLEVTIVFICLLTGLWFIGIENFLLIALLAAVFNVIPYLGPLIGIAIGLIITVSTGYQMDLYLELMPLLGKLLVVFITTQLLDNVLLQPLIYSNSVNAHPLEIFLVIIIAGNMFGIGGMVLAVPAYTVLRILIKEVKDNSSFIQKMYE